MNSPSSKYLYGRTSTFGTNVNVTAADYAKVDAEIAAEVAARPRATVPAFLAPEVIPYASVEIIRVPAPVSPVERTIEDAQRASFRSFLTDPATGPALDQMLADNERLDDELQAERDAEDERDRWDADNACSARCGYCGRCS